MVAQSWFRNLLITLKKPEPNDSEHRIAVLAFEVSGLMTKLLQLWQALTDKQVARLREDITNSIGIKKLVSEDDDYIARLMCSELTENLVRIAKDVTRLSKKCNSPVLRSFELAFGDLMKTGVDPFSWLLPWKKMEKKIPKMEQFILMNSNLYREMEILADIEHSFRRIKSNDNTDSISLVEYEKKLTWKLQIVKHLKDKSLWNRTYDYTVLLLARSVFSIYGRIVHVFGINYFAGSTVHDIRESPSTIIVQSSVYPFENYDPRSSSISLSGPLSRKMNGVNFYSGPLRNTVDSSNPPPEKYSSFSFYSGPLKKMTVKYSVSKTRKSRFRLWPSRDSIQKTPDGLTLASSPLTGYTNFRNDSPQVMEGNREASLNALFHRVSSLKESKILNPPPETLGAAALALHYANLIVFIEKLAATPHLVGHNARNDLYRMLPARIRITLRSKLKPHFKTLSASVYDTALCGEWKEAIRRILEWLSPLAHNMIKWQSERSLEHQKSGNKTNVLLVQTLYFANQEKTEDVITELLVGLNFIWRFGKEITAVLPGYFIRRTVYDYLDD